MQHNMPCQLVSWDEFYQLCCDLAEQVRQSGYQFDTLLAIGRGGYMPARILSDVLGIMNLISFKIEHYHGAHKSSQAVVAYPLLNNAEMKKVLLVDDVSDSGDTFEVALAHVKQRAAPEEIRTAVLHYKTVATNEPDFYAGVIRQWRWLIYPWAVTEDLSTLIAAISPQPETVTDLQKSILDRHGIQVSEQQVSRALKLINSHN